MMAWFMSNLRILEINTWWLMWSNDLLKSRRNTRTVFPLPSVSAYQVCRLIRASTAEQPKIDRNCLGSSFWWMDSRIQFAKKDSKILDRVGVRDICRKSLLMS